MDLERTMHFIAEQQAQLTASVQKHDEQIGALTDLVGRLAQAEIRLVERMEKVENSQQEMHAAMARLFERMDRFIQGLDGNGHKPR